MDDKIQAAYTPECFIETFKTYKEAKTDIYTKIVKIPMGVDGVDWKDFERNINAIAEHVCKRAREGRHFFSPFREIEIPKPPYTRLQDARKENKIRILSIATIKDVIFQKILYSVIEDYCEMKFDQLENEVSYAYRRGKSAPIAAKNIYNSIVNEGYQYALDGDIKKFFDEIPHDRLCDKIKLFFGEDQDLVNKYLRRFVSSDRVEYSDYNGDVEKYYNQKPKRTVRKKGIPQGGVLSGLVANIYLNDLDGFVVQKLYPKYNDQIKYLRYADDFIVLFKDSKDIHNVYTDIKLYLANEGLEIHDIGDKTKEIDFSQEALEFLGFAISPKGISIRKINVEKFKKRLVEKINNSKIYSQDTSKGLGIMLGKMRFKLLGSGAFDEEFTICPLCGKKRYARSWMRYFLAITDVRQLRTLDIWIRKVVYRSYYHKTHSRLKKSRFLAYDLPSLEKLYYEYKKENRTSVASDNCHCE